MLSFLTVNIASEREQITHPPTHPLLDSFLSSKVLLIKLLITDFIQILHKIMEAYRLSTEVFSHWELIRFIQMHHIYILTWKILNFDVRYCSQSFYHYCFHATIHSTSWHIETLDVLLFLSNVKTTMKFEFVLLKTLTICLLKILRFELVLFQQYWPCKKISNWQWHISALTVVGSSSYDVKVFERFGISFIKQFRNPLL